MIKVGNYYQTTIFAIEPFGIFVRNHHHPTVDILVPVTEIPESQETSITEKFKIGDELQVKIIYIGDETTARAIIIE